MEEANGLLNWFRSLGQHVALVDQAMRGLRRASPQFVLAQCNDLERAFQQLRAALFGKSLPTAQHDPPLLVALADAERAHEEIDRLHQRNRALRQQLHRFLDIETMDDIEEEAAQRPSPREQLALPGEE